MFNHSLSIEFGAQAAAGVRGVTRPVWSPRAVGTTSRRSERARSSYGAATRLVAAVLIEALVILGFVAMSLGLGANGYDVTGFDQPAAAGAPAASLPRPLPAPAPMPLPGH